MTLPLVMASMTPIETFWNGQSQLLKEFTIGHDRESAVEYHPLPDKHRLLQSEQPSRPSNSASNPVHRASAKHTHNDYDSWGDDASSSEEDLYQSYPYPMMMYPMVIAPAAHTKHSKHKGRKAKKKVHYRNTPTYLSLGGSRNGDTDPFDPRNNSVLRRYEYVFDDPKSMRIPANPVQYVNEVPPKKLDLVQNQGNKSEQYGGSSFQVDPAQTLLLSLLDEMVNEQAYSIVRELVHDTVDNYMQETVAYDTLWDLTGEIISGLVPDLIREVKFEVILEDISQELIVEPEIKEQTDRIAIEVLDHYSDKVCKRDIIQITKTSGEKLMDSLCLDNLLTYITRQGELWTEGEHANKLLDDLMLNLLLRELVDVEEKRRSVVNDKPLRRYYEKMLTDSVLGVFLEEISKCLDEDMADLDEYERGLGNSQPDYQVPIDLKKWFDGR